MRERKEEKLVPGAVTSFLEKDGKEEYMLSLFFLSSPFFLSLTSYDIFSLFITIIWTGRLFCMYIFSVLQRVDWYIILFLIFLEILQVVFAVLLSLCSSTIPLHLLFLCNLVATSPTECLLIFCFAQLLPASQLSTKITVVLQNVEMSSNIPNVC